MMINNRENNMNLIEDLSQIGLTLNESKVYIAMLEGEQFSAAQLAKNSSINRTKIYFVLAGLIKKGFCEELDGKFRTFRALKPQKTMNKLIDLHSHNLRKAKKVAEILIQNYCKR